MALYDVGERVVLSTELRDSDGILVDADVTLTITFPDDSTVSPALSHPGTGKYSGSFLVTVPGDYSYVWSSTGVVEVVDDGGFSVVSAGSGRKLYATTEELRAHLGDSQRRNLDETELRRALAAASRSIDRYTGSFFWRDKMPTTKTYSPVSKYGIDILPLASTEDLIVAVDNTGGRVYGTSWTNGSHFELSPENQDTDSAHAFTRLDTLGGYLPVGRNTLRITGYHGWSSVPDAVREATVIKATALFKRGDSPFGIAGSGDFGAIRISRYEDPDVIKLLDPFMPVLVGLI